MSVIHFYVDDSGSRRLDRKPPHVPPWFAFGGVLFREEDKGAIESSHDRFVSQWPIRERPLHSSDIRGKRNGFEFLHEQTVREAFFAHLEDWLLSLPVVVLACVIDRSGYDDRFNAQYEHRQRWQLCKSAFPIVLERAAKFALRNDARLALAFEHSGSENKNLKQYFHEALTTGLPFSPETSARYLPLTAEELRATVTGELTFKTKASRCMQIADLVLHPICKGRYTEDNRALMALRTARKLIDSYCDDPEVQGIKYYCFPKTTKAPTESEPLAA